MSDEKSGYPGCLGCIGDDKLPNYIGIIINHYKDPYSTTSISWKVRPCYVRFSSEGSRNFPIINQGAVSGLDLQGQVPYFLVCGWNPKQPYFNGCLVQQPFFM